MTPVQFVYWLNGYLSIKYDSNTNYYTVIETIKNVMLQIEIVKNSGDIVACFTGNSL